MKHSNIRYFSKAILILGLSFSLANQSLGESKNVDEPAFTNSQPISSGFVFVEGQYVESPYVVSLVGLKICINNRVIADYSHIEKGSPIRGSGQTQKIP